MLLVAIALSAISGLSMALYLLNKVAIRLRCFADASVMMLNEAPCGIAILTRDDDLVMCNEPMIERLELEAENGLYEQATGVPQTFSVRRNPRLAPFVDALDRSEPLDCMDADGRRSRWLRQLHVKDTEWGQVRALIFHELRAAADPYQAEPNTAGLWDELTGLANITLLIDRTEQALEVAARHDSTLAMLILELDQFEKIERDQGAAAAQQLIVEAAGRISATGRAMETVARIGRNRFAVLLKSLEGSQTAVLVAERFLRSASFSSETTSISGTEITASVGLVINSRSGTTPQRLLEQAASACGSARDAGGNRALLHASALVDPPIPAR